eukprot:evm.model.NODE_19166_length_72781_cov_34.074345.14
MAAAAVSAAGSLLAWIQETFQPLTTTEFKEDVCIAVFMYVIGYAALGGFSPLMHVKRKAWILSVLCAVGMSLGSIPYVWKLATEHAFVTSEMVYADDRLSLFIMAFFMTFLVLDLAIGLGHYAGEIGLLTGWFHHCLYMGMCVWAVVNGISISAVATMIMEIPTLVMALGRVYKGLRSDSLFGFTFLVTRILYLGYYIYRLMCDVSPRVVVWPVCVPAMVLHVFWFHGFIQQQRRLRKSHLEGRAVGEEGRGGKRVVEGENEKGGKAA